MYMYVCMYMLRIFESLPLHQQVHVFTVHPTMYTKLTQIAGMALFILAKQDTTHNRRLLQPQNKKLQEREGETVLVSPV